MLTHAGVRFGRSPSRRVRGRVRLAEYGVPVLDERDGRDPDAAVAAADALGYPVVVKLCGDAIAHKTERGLVRLGLARRRRGARARRPSCSRRPRPDDGAVELLVAPMVRGHARADRRRAHATRSSGRA